MAFVLVPLESQYREVEKLVSRLAHNQKIVGSNPTFATTEGFKTLFSFSLSHGSPKSFLTFLFAKHSGYYLHLLFTQALLTVRMLWNVWINARPESISLFATYTALSLTGLHHYSFILLCHVSNCLLNNQAQQLIGQLLL